MARYIKANPLVARFLHLDGVRNTVKDGNYLLWQADIQPFGPMSLLPSILEQIGGIVLSPHEAREEQDGTVTRPLPVATDPRFVVNVAAAAPAAEPEEPETSEPEEQQEEEAAGEEEQGSGKGYETPEYESPEYENPEYATGESQPEAPAEEETTNEQEG